jgi:hypothetical protein
MTTRDKRHEEAVPSWQDDVVWMVLSTLQKEVDGTNRILIKLAA